MQNLVIVESPAKAATIKNYLGSGYKVTASKGHVRDLPKSSLGVDIENGFAAHYINIRGKGPLINELKKDAKASTKVFLATDPDREGEAISWHLATVLGVDPSKIRRVTFNEITKSAVKSAIKAPRDIDMDLVNSQQARRILDRIVGYKLSPFLWKNVRSGLSAGRVQSVATRIIVEREKEIREFDPKEYWSIDTLFSTADRKNFKAKFYGNESGKFELSDEASAMKIVETVRNSDFTVSNVKRTLRMKSPAPPFTTSTMQQEASRKLGFQSQRIMRVAQELYEGVNIGAENGGVQGLITYMRTDSLRIANEASEAAKEYINGKFGDKYYPDTPRIYKTKAEAQDAHEAIRPSSLKFDPEKIKSSLTTDQYKLYKLIWSRFIASQMASAELDTVSIDILSSGYIFRASGYTVRFQGYMAVYEESEDNTDESAPEKTKLPDLKEGDKLKLESITPQQHFTEPPPRYTEASLIKFLEEKGIGRPSTYTPIITTIIARGYVNREGKALIPTPLGEVTTQIMKEAFPDVVDYAFTAQMEDNLDNIENGKSTMYDVLSGFYTGFEHSLEAAEKNYTKDDISVPVEETDIICEKCGSHMVIKNGRYGKFAACPNYPECKNTKPLDKNGNPSAENDKTAKVEKTDMKCELCGSDMVLRTGRYGSFYACSRYPECKNTKRIAKSIGVSCPLCGSNIVVKQSKRQTYFYSCEKYPECKFSSWDLPLNEKCPNCGQMLFRKKGKSQAVCHNKECGYKADIESESETNDEQQY